VPRFATKYFGAVEWPDEEMLVFPQGLPAFEHERLFARLAPAGYKPIIFLQSASTPELCFLAAPAAAVDPAYELDAQSTELELVQGVEAPLEVLVLLTVREGQAGTANLLAPVAINPSTRRAVQAIRRDRRYSCRHPLAGTPCGNRLAQCL